MSVKEMTWAYRLQGTRIDENIKIYWFVHIIKLFISDTSFFIFKFSLNSRSPIFLIVFDVHFWIASFCWGISCYLLITALLSNVLQKYHFKMFSLNFFLCFFYYFVHGNGSGFEYIKYLHSLTKSVLHKYLRFFI